MGSGHHPRRVGPPKGESGGMKLDVETRLNRWIDRLTLLRAVRTIFLIAFLLAIAAGALERIVEPKVFKTLGLSFWFSAVTISTVGYGDIVPQSVGGRLIAVVLMFIGISLIPVTSSLVVSVLVGKRTRAAQAELETALARIEKQLARLEQQ
jgi:voltage-gated potassium channel Kch